MAPDLKDRIERIAGSRPARMSPMGGGCVGDVFLALLENGAHVVIKAGDAGSGLDIEGFMLGYLKDHSSLPVPDVLHAEAGLLLMTYVETGGGLTAGAQEHAAELLAALHNIRAGAFGFERDTLIGGLDQPNPWTERWRDFFRDQRLLHIGRQALDAGRLPAPLMARLETLAGRLERWTGEPAHPSLLHGDLWTGNV
ncbi:MAG: fructosamine kinase family protein, partial [Rhodospirillales bacterium]|nr:fructosamine kinase family protein [Rhodospirillales bacterium]